MSRTIQIKRGLKADLPALAVGELGFTIDTHEVFIGSAAGNVPVESKESSELLVQLESDGAAMQSNIAQLNNEVLAMSRGLGQSISSLAILNSTYPAGDTKDHIVAGNVKEVATLTVTAIPSASSNVTVTLDGVAHTLLANPLIHITTAALASAIRSEVFAGWVTGGTGNVVTFESTTVGPEGSHSFSGGTSGSAGSMVTTTEGEAANFHRYFWSGTAWLDGGVDFFTQEYKEAIEAQVLADFTAAENARQVEYDAAEAIRQADYLQASQAAAANQELYDELLEEGVLQTSINTKLAALELEYAPELTTLQQNDVTLSQQLAETAKKTEKIVSVKEYGAVGDGIIDDTTAIQNTINALNAGDTLLMPNGTYRTTSTITVDKEITIDGNQATIECDHLLIGLKIKKAVGSMGYGSARRLTANISVSRKMLTTDPNAIGVEITDCYRGWFDFKRLSTHGIGMRLVGEKDGTTYNRFNLGSVTDCYVGIQAETLTDVGWVTENTVYGGNFGSGNITSKEQTDSHIKLLNSGVRIMDNNKFFSCSFEGFQKNGVIIDRAKHNLFFGCRFEVPFADFLLKLLDVTDNQSNQFWGCFGLAETLKNGKIYDEGTKNRISGSEYPVGGFEYYEKTVYYFNKPGQVKQTGFNSGLTVIPLGGRTLREISASGSSLTIDFSQGAHFDVTCVAGIDITTIAFANIPSIGVLPTISFIQAAGGNTISGFPSYFLSTGDAVPVKRAYGRDVYQLARGNAYTNEIYALSHYKN